MRRRYPFGVAASVFAGAPAAGVDDAVLGAAAEGQVVDVGVAAGGIPGDVVDFAVLRVSLSIAPCGGGPSIERSLCLLTCFIATSLIQDGYPKSRAAYLHEYPRVVVAQ